MVEAVAVAPLVSAGPDIGGPGFGHGHALAAALFPLGHIGGGGLPFHFAGVAALVNDGLQAASLLPCPRLLGVVVVE
jgi:hypothetical protein